MQEITLKTPPKEFDTNCLKEKSDHDDYIGVDGYLWLDDETPIGELTVSWGWSKFYVSSDGVSGWGTIENTGFYFFEDQKSFEKEVDGDEEDEEDLEED